MARKKWAGIVVIYTTLLQSLEQSFEGWRSIPKGM